ncbi:D-glycero-alpha-D-manno-heptose-1,7-bisphosphate 7-phosphatase [Paractinoplanes rishiriensis]|uniref:D,D-heptose 1,7-bisphosphate phosphatase n=1 Tax=Paractinoplanes rishiriensis TaxID=1050105 RepID=A0A919MUD9_9ACTN|nr:HAD-IIIA family hydrolase [Actinoplanes rishiriensis]GIE95229.1 D,D-heptose 1,7-bisphosphate phosphatase [Actinoplanes rishiriensis]
MEPVFVPGPKTGEPSFETPFGLLCDRDGTIIEDRPRYVRSPADITFLPGAAGALSRAVQVGFTVVLITNQSAVGRGLLALAEAVRLNEVFVAQLTAAGVPVAGTLLCPHAPDSGCPCRKPAPGMVLAALRRFELDEKNTILVGDAKRDIMAAHGAGVRGILVRTGHGRRAEHDVANDPVLAGTDVVDNLDEAVRLAARHLGRSN